VKLLTKVTEEGKHHAQSKRETELCCGRWSWRSGRITMIWSW